MDFTPEQVAKLATLTKLRLSPEQASALAEDLASILDWADQLQEVNVTDVPPTIQVIPSLTHQGDDTPSSTGFLEEEARSWISHSTLPVEMGSLRVPNVL